MSWHEDLHGHLNGTLLELRLFLDGLRHNFEHFLEDSLIVCEVNAKDRQDPLQVVEKVLIDDRSLLDAPMALIAVVLSASHFIVQLEFASAKAAL